MVHGDSHYTHECEVAQNSIEGPGKLYTVREVGHHTTSTQRLWGETGNKRIDSHKDISGTKDGPETYAQGMAPSSLFQNMTPTKTSNFWFLANVVFYVVNQRRTFSVLDNVD